jgi:LmbE family N-acetylglucosaminyl deacetylase
MLEFKEKKILILAPHTDDAEFGMGGSIAKFIEDGNTVYSAAFSACKHSVLSDFPEDILVREVKEASYRLGIEEKNLFLFEYDVRTFSSHRQSILDAIIQLRETLRPDVVFIPSLLDVHQDHKVIAEEGRRAFKFGTVLSYELPWNNFSFGNTCFIILDDRHIEAKEQAILAYKSQAHRIYSSPDFARSLARTRGVQINNTFAECFEIVRLVLQ